MPLLSVLDLALVTTACGPSAALRGSIELARAVDALGYHRYWVAEHHNLASVASSAPEVLITRIAGATSRIRVGSGGVMLPNHAPLMVAERFKTLEAFFPGRIDLGLGRAPGTDQTTSYALRFRHRDGAGDDFLERLQELLRFETGEFPEGHVFRRITPMPADVALPPVFILGSSDYGAEVSARMGLGFAFAHHFASHDAAEAMLAYRAAFTQTGWREGPHAILGAAAIVAETDAEAQRLASSADLNGLRRARGVFLPLPSPEEALAHVQSVEDRLIVSRNRQRLFVGAPDAVAAALRRLADETQADEIMVTTPVFDPAARVRSYALLAEAFAPLHAGAGA